MNSAEGTLFLVERNVALNQSQIETMGFKFPLTPRTSEEASFVLVPFWFYDENAGESALRENQEKTSTSGIGTTNLPPHSRI